MAFENHLPHRVTNMLEKRDAREGENDVECTKSPPTFDETC